MVNLTFAGVEAIRFSLWRPILVDGMITAKNSRLGLYRKDSQGLVEVYENGCANGYGRRQYRHLKLQNVPGMLHAVASQVLTLEKLLLIEEAPFHRVSIFRKEVGFFVNQGPKRQMWQANFRA